MEAPKSGNMRQTNAFLRLYYTDPEFRVCVNEEAAEQRKMARLISPTDYEDDIRKQLGRMWARDKKVMQGWAGPEPGRTPEESRAARLEKYQNDPEYRERIVASAEKWRVANKEKIAEALRTRYNTDEEFREKMRLRGLVRTQKARENGRLPDWQRRHFWRKLPRS